MTKLKSRLVVWPLLWHTTFEINYVTLLEKRFLEMFCIFPPEAGANVLCSYKGAEYCSISPAPGKNLFLVAEDRDGWRARP